MRKRIEIERRRIERKRTESEKKEQIEREKMEFLEIYSEELYKDLSSKGEKNEPVIYTITKLLLNPKPLSECEEYQMLCSFIKPIVKEKSNRNRMYLSSILGCIIQVYQKALSYEMATQIQNLSPEQNTGKNLVMQ